MVDEYFEFKLGSQEHESEESECTNRDIMNTGENMRKNLPEVILLMARKMMPAIPNPTRVSLRLHIRTL